MAKTTFKVEIDKETLGTTKELVLELGKASQKVSEAFLEMGKIIDKYEIARDILEDDGDKET